MSELSEDHTRCPWNSPFYLQLTWPERRHLTSEVMMRMAWCEVITRTATRQIAIRSEINTWKYFITWFAGISIRYDPAAVSYCG